MDSLPCSAVLKWVPLSCQKSEYAKKPFSVIFPGSGPQYHIWYKTLQQTSYSRILSPASLLGTQKITHTLKNILKQFLWSLTKINFKKLIVYTSYLLKKPVRVCHLVWSLFICLIVPKLHKFWHYATLFTWYW